MKNFAVATLLATFPCIGLAQSAALATKEKNKTTQRVNTSPSTASGGTSAPVLETVLKSAAKFDATAGEKTFYYENFEQGALGEFPTGWNTNGTGEITTLDNFPGKWLRLHHPYTYLTANKTDFGEDYTIEFDIILQLKNSGRMYPQVSFGLFSAGTEPTSDNEFLKDDNKYGCVTALLSPAENNSTKLWLKSYVNGKSFFVGEPKAFPKLEQWYGQPVHMAIQVQKEHFRMWANAVKIVDVPNGVPANYVMNQLQIRVHHTNYNDSQYGIYISNIKMAKGLPDKQPTVE